MDVRHQEWDISFVSSSMREPKSSSDSEGSPKVYSFLPSGLNRF